MHQELPLDAEVEGWLRTLGVEALSQWDVLVFLYRHQTTLVGADYLARLLGYATEVILAALDAVEVLGLVERSRVSGGARLYQFAAPPDDQRRKALERLVELAGHRDGRLLLSAPLRRGGRTAPEALAAARGVAEDARQFSRATQFPERGERSSTWLKVI